MSNVIAVTLKKNKRTLDGHIIKSRTRNLVGVTHSDVSPRWDSHLGISGWKYVQTTNVNFLFKMNHQTNLARNKITQVYKISTKYQYKSLDQAAVAHLHTFVHWV